MKPGYYIKAAVLFIIVTTLGCSSNTQTSQYFDSAKEFNKIYFETVETVDLGDTMGSIKRLQSEVNKDNIERLGVLVEEIKKSIPKSRERLYIDFRKRYVDLVFLNESYLRVNSLSQDERGRIDMIFISIGVDRANWKDKKSAMVWE